MPEAGGGSSAAAAAASGSAAAAAAAAGAGAGMTFLVPALQVDLYYCCYELYNEHCTEQSPIYITT